MTSIKAGQSLSYQGDKGSYYITAVDIAGRESGPSNVVTLEQISAPPPAPSESDVTPEPPPSAQPQSEVGSESEVEQQQ